LPQLVVMPAQRTEKGFKVKFQGFSEHCQRDERRYYLCSASPKCQSVVY